METNIILDGMILKVITTEEEEEEEEERKTWYQCLKL